MIVLLCLVAVAAFVAIAKFIAPAVRRVLWLGPPPRPTRQSLDRAHRAAKRDLAKQRGPIRVVR